MPHARVIGISCIPVPLDGLRAYLRSTHVMHWLRSNLPPKGGGFRGMSVGNLSRLPVPHEDAEVWLALEQCGRDEADKIISDFMGKTG